MAANTVQLNFGGLTNLDLEEVLAQFNLEPSCDFDSLMADGRDDNNNASDQQSESIALMEELTILTQKQLDDSAPSPKLLPCILHKNLKTNHNLIGEESIACDVTVSTCYRDSLRTDCLPHIVENHFEVSSCGTGTDESHLPQNTNQDAHCDTSDRPFSVSRGVSASSCGVNHVNSWKDIATDEDRATTVFLDLRTEVCQVILTVDHGLVMHM